MPPRKKAGHNHKHKEVTCIETNKELGITKDKDYKIIDLLGDTIFVHNDAGKVISVSKNLFTNRK